MERVWQERSKHESSAVRRATFGKITHPGALRHPSEGWDSKKRDNYNGSAFLKQGQRCAAPRAPLEQEVVQSPSESHSVRRSVKDHESRFESIFVCSVYESSVLSLSVQLANANSIVFDNYKFAFCRAKLIKSFLDGGNRVFGNH